MAENNEPNQGNEGKGRGGGGRGPGGPRGPQQMMPRNLMTMLLLAGLAAATVMFVSSQQNQAHELKSWQDFQNYARGGWFQDAVTVEGDRITGVLKDETPGVDAKWVKPIRVMVPIQSDTRGYYLKQLDDAKQRWIPKTDGFPLWPLIINFGPVVLVVFLLFFAFRSLRNAGGGSGMFGSFGRSKAKLANKEHVNVTLEDVAGVDDAKDEVREIIEFLKNPGKFQRLGGRVPRGVLLVGEPGCGKTLLAKAVAGEADVPFFSISGSDFVEMFVGVGASRVRDLFRQAKDSSPCIIFLDEIDAVGRRRTNEPHGGGQESAQTLNAILVEMDGFDTNDQVIVMAATNRADVLDPALIRPGRFDRQIHVPLPDVKGRLEILRVHAKKVKMGPDVEIDKVARGTPMFSGADLAALINEAAIAATLLDKDCVTQADLEEARDKVRFGRTHKSRKTDEVERVATAYHEAGHTVLQYLLPAADPLHKVTIIPRGRALGATFSLPEKDRYGFNQKYLHDTMRVLCGGRIAEEKKTNDTTSGAAMDIRMATQFARRMVLEWGMSQKLGFVSYGYEDAPDRFIPERPYSEDTARVVDDEVKRLIGEAYTDARKMVEDNWDRVEAVANALLRYETLSSDEVDRIMKGENLAKPTVGDLLKAEQEKAKPKAIPTASPNLDGPPGDVLPQPA